MTDVPQGQPQAAAGLTPRLIQGLQADFIPATWPGSNDSGLTPFGDYVLVKMDTCAPATSGGVLLVEEQVDRMSEASESGCIYAVGALAFKAHGPDCPRAGDRVYIEKYAGIKARGADGSLYRIMEDRCIAAGLAPTDQGEA